jgi:uncharacterized membrane protein
MLTFCNAYTERVWVAYMFLNTDLCGGDGGGFQAIGWYAIEPNACVRVYGNSLGDVNNTLWYYYAENADRSVYWAGPVSVTVSDEAFNHCLLVASNPGRVVGFRQFDVGDNDDFTLTLTG